MAKSKKLTARKTVVVRSSGSPGITAAWIAVGVVLAALAVVAAVIIGSGAGGSANGLRVPDTRDIHSLLVDPSNSEHIFYGNHSGLYESPDGGKSWQPVGTLANQDAMGLAVDGKNLWVAGHDVFFASSDRGKNFAPVSGKLPGTDIHGLASAPSRPGTIYAFVVGFGLQKSVDGGKSWAAVVSKGIAPGAIMGLTVDGRDDKIVYAMDMQAGLVKSTDGGASWGESGLAVPAIAATSIPGSHRILAATQQGIYLTDDGVQWRQLRADPAALVAVSASDPAVVYAVGLRGELTRSADSAATWH